MRKPLASIPGISKLWSKPEGRAISSAFLNSPTTSDHSFGTVPEAKCRGDSIPGGEMLLRWGRHKGPKKGYVAVHIWNEHKGEMRLLGFRRAQDVPEFVSRIVKKGTRCIMRAGICAA